LLDTPIRPSLRARVVLLGAAIAPSACSALPTLEPPGAGEQPPSEKVIIEAVPIATALHEREPRPGKENTRAPFENDVAALAIPSRRAGL
jgi:hypothetical protein